MKEKDPTRDEHRGVPAAGPGGDASEDRRAADPALEDLTFEQTVGDDLTLDQTVGDGQTLDRTVGDDVPADGEQHAGGAAHEDLPRTLDLPPGERALEGAGGIPRTRLSRTRGGASVTSPADSYQTAPSAVGGGGGGAALAPGMRLGSYVLVAPLGEGAQGSVWRAYNDVADREFALKFLAAKLARSDAAVRSMRSEAAVLFNLTHRSIVRLNNIERVGPHLFLVMELIEGPSVQAVLVGRRKAQDEKRRGFSVEECVWLLEQLAPALDYAASQKVTHRDIKPANMMLTADVDPRRPLSESQAKVKLCDFGIAIVERDAGSTERLGPAGTLPYMAPEVLRGEKPTTQADIYSLAATLYALHRDSPPYKGGTMSAMMARQAEGPPPPLASGNKAFDAAIMAGLSVKPEQRQATFDDFLYQASGGRRGKRAAQRARGQRRATVAASLVALGAVFYAVDPFGVRRGRAQFDLSAALGTRDGAPVYRDRLLELTFDYASPGDEEVDVQLDGGETMRVGPVEPGGDRYQVVVTLDRQGPHELSLVGADRGSSIGQQRVFLDTEVELLEPALRLPVEGPYEVSRPVAVDFYLAEPDVEVRDLTGGGARLLSLERDGARARALLTVEPDPELDSWSVTRRFGLRDPFGNEVERSVALEVFDKERVLARIRIEDAAPVESLHLWDIGAELEAVERLTSRIAAAEPWIEFDERARLRAAADARRAALETRLASTPPASIELALPEASPEDFVTRGVDDVPVLYTRRRAPELRGKVPHARSAQLTATAQRLTVDRAPEVARDSGEFDLQVTLDPSAEGELKLALPDNGPFQLLRLVHDVAAPSVQLVAPPDRAVLATETAEVELRAADPGSGLARVELTVGEGGAPVVAEDAGGGRWRGRVALPQDGPNSCRARVVDHVGNEAEYQFVLVRDTTAPTWRDTGEAPRATTGTPTRLSFDFDEPIARASATWRLFGAGREEVATGRLGDADLERVGATVSFELMLPFRDCVELAVELAVEDQVGNPRAVQVTRAVEHDPWGAVPSWIRDNAEAVLDAAELRGLLGDALAGEADPYVTTEDGRRYPRCVRHLRSGVEFVFVPGGTFHYGPAASSSGGRGVRVDVSSFYIARTEVSGRQFLRPGDFEGYPREESEDSDLPVRTNRVDAARWCARYQFSLPTEVQWEYAASGPADREYPWGDELDPARRNGPQYSALASAPALVPVDAFPEGRSWCGALQMAGNLFEICRDDLDPATVTEGTRDPVGLVDTTRQAYRVRGSSFSSKDPLLETTHGRHEVTQSTNLKRAGLRPVWELTERR